MARLQKKKTPQGKTKKRLKKNGEDASQAPKGASAQTAAARPRAQKAPARKLALRASKPGVAAKAPLAGQKLNWIQKSIQFLREVKVELKKVTWPSRKQTLGTTVVVLALVILISLFLGMVDMALTSFVRVVLQ